MQKTSPSRPKRAKKAPLPKVSPPEPLEVKPKNKYAEAPKVGGPTIGVDTNYVHTVGLGQLKVVTAKGISDDRDTDV